MRGVLLAVTLVALLAGCTEPVGAASEAHAATLTTLRMSEAWPPEAVIRLDGPSGPATTWTLDVDGIVRGNGTELPSLHTMTFAEARPYNVTLTVTDGERYSTTAMEIDARPAARKFGKSQDHVGSWHAGLWGGAGETGTCPGAYVEDLFAQIPGDDVLYDRFEVDEASIGFPYVVSITLPQGEVPSQAGVTFLDGVDGRIPHAQFVTRQGATVLVSGFVPDGAAAAHLWSCNDGPTTAHYEARVP